MPKMKTKKAAKKRVSVTGTGKFKRSRAFKKHILTKKSSKRKMDLRKGGYVAVVDEPKVRQMLPYS